MEIQRWIKSYSCQCPPVTGNNGFHDINGDYISDKKGDEVLLDIVLEDVPTPVSVALAEKLEAPSVEVDYTTPVPKHDAFYKTSYSADCDDADPDHILLLRHRGRRRRDGFRPVRVVLSSGRNVGDKARTYQIPREKAVLQTNYVQRRQDLYGGFRRC